MATKSKQRLPWKRRVQDAVAALFTSHSDLTAPEAFTLPSSIDKRKNAQVDAFVSERAVMYNFALAHAVKQAAETAFKKEKNAFCERFGITEDNKYEPGHEETLSRDDVSCLIKVTQPQHRIDRGILRSKLMTEMKMNAEKADAFIRTVEVAGKAPVYLTPTVAG
jgi:hypothetical protein